MDRIEPITGISKNHQDQEHRERRSNETVANAAALRLGLAAQLFASHEPMQSVPVLPLAPAARAAARYAQTQHGLGLPVSMGFVRTT
ncbi:MAG: hypothetical protein AAF739_08545 [Pseudomonadota bacterium]